MDRALAISGGVLAAWFVMLCIVLFSEVTPPPVDRGHDCTWDKWGCR